MLLVRKSIYSASKFFLSMKINENHSIFPGWWLGWLILGRCRARPENLASQVHERCLGVGRQPGHLDTSNRLGEQLQRWHKYFFDVITCKTHVFYENHDILSFLTHFPWVLDSSKKKTLICISKDRCRYLHIDVHRLRCTYICISVIQLSLNWIRYTRNEVVT